MYKILYIPDCEYIWYYPDTYFYCAGKPRNSNYELVCVKQKKAVNYMLSNILAYGLYIRKDNYEKFYVKAGYTLIKCEFEIVEVPDV